MKVSASQSVDLGSIPLSIDAEIQNAIHSFLVGVQHQRDSVEKKPASLFIVSLGKALSEIPLSSCGKQVYEPSALIVGRPRLLSLSKD